MTDVNHPSYVLGTSHRKCGPCTACCTFLFLEELDKPRNVTCPHVCGAGCSIYNERPKMCREYACAWLQGHFEDDVRPDRIGFLLHPDSMPERDLVTVYAFEMWPGALDSKRGREVLETLSCRYRFPVFLVRDDQVVEVLLHPESGPGLLQLALEYIERYNMPLTTDGTITLASSPGPIRMSGPKPAS